LKEESLLNKHKVILKASWLQLRIYVTVMLGVVAAGTLSQIIVNLSIQDNESTQLSIGNILTVLLIFVGAVLPATLFKRIAHLGASRKEYYTGLVVAYGLWSAAFSVFNILWLALENGVLRKYQDNFNILEVFHWDQFSLIGTFLYQFGAYMVLVSLLSLLFSGLKSIAGWIIWIALIAAIPIGTSVPSFRPKVADGFVALLFNDSLLQGTALTLGLSAVFLYAGWLFTSRRTL
jgi:hypothetical protein